MPYLEKSQFLLPGADIKAVKLKKTKAFLREIDKVVKQQEKILQSKKVRPETWNMVINI